MTFVKMIIGKASILMGEHKFPYLTLVNISHPSESMDQKFFGSTEDSSVPNVEMVIVLNLWH